jgi:hypothetical protein
MRALEDSGSVAPQRGWGATHLTARDASGALLGVAPLYVKGHSYGCVARLANAGAGLLGRRVSAASLRFVASPLSAAQATLRGTSLSWSGTAAR